MGDFQRFVQAIVAGDLAAVGRMLQAGPELASVASSEGATRKQSKPFFIVRISHYLYVGTLPCIWRLPPTTLRW